MVNLSDYGTTERDREIVKDALLGAQTPFYNYDNLQLLCVYPIQNVIKLVQN